MKNFLKLSVLIFAFALFAFIPKNEKIKVVIDASHGGEDNGASFHGHTEKNITLSISKEIQKLNTNKNIEIYYTREDDKSISLVERVNFIKTINPDIVISLHTNANKNETSSGIECFVTKEEKLFEKSNSLAEKLLAEFTEKMNLKSRGVNKAPFFLLKKSEVPAIIVELGFLSNLNDKKYLTDQEKQTEIARTILNFASKIEK
ncbi:MAG: N-acetylmuramoyl-L-alanine amidase [Bacteroidota bacterium]